MPFDETTSKPFKNVSIQLILNEDDHKDQTVKQEDWQTPLSSPNENKGGELPANTFVERKALPESPYSINTNIASSVGSGPSTSSGPIGNLGTGSSNHVGMGAPVAGSDYYQQNVPYNIRVPYYPIQSSQEYTDNRRGRRFRRRYNQIVRKYMCSFPGCTKSYGSLNHLNTHIVSKKHGQRKSKADFQSHEDQNPHNLHGNAGGWSYANPPPHTGHQGAPPPQHQSGPAYLHLPHQLPQDPRLQPQQQPHVTHMGGTSIAPPQSYYLHQSVWVPNYQPQYQQAPPPPSIQSQSAMPHLHPPPPILQHQHQHQHQMPQPPSTQHLALVQPTSYHQPLQHQQQQQQLQLPSHLQSSSMSQHGLNYQEESVSSSPSEESETSPTIKAK